MENATDINMPYAINIIFMGFFSHQIATTWNAIHKFERILSRIYKQQPSPPNACLTSNND